MESLETLYKQVMEKPLQILDIFNEFFGEDRVDLQGFLSVEHLRALRLTDEISIRRHIATDNGYGFILVHFPYVKIENENGRYTDINHLFAKVEIDLRGTIRGRFLLNRSEYSLLHIQNNYMHSHISNVPFHDFTQFQSPCTGTGPINSTICSLANSFDADIWRLFCLELDKYVQVESIAGTPYHRLESLVPGGTSSYTDYNQIVVRNSVSIYRVGTSDRSVLKPRHLASFIKYVIDNNTLRFTFVDGNYCLAMSPTDFYIKVSNLFIEWYNKEYSKGNVHSTYDVLLDSGIINERILSNGRFYRPNNGRSTDYSSYIGKKVCVFKGREITLTIPDLNIEEQINNSVVLLSEEIAEYVLTKILNVINFRYGTDRSKESTSGKKVIFF